MSGTEIVPDIRAGKQAPTVRDDRAEWETPRVIVAAGRDTAHGSDGGSDTGVFPATDSIS